MEWIKCSDRLPELTLRHGDDNNKFSECVLVSVNNGEWYCVAILEAVRPSYERLLWLSYETDTNIELYSSGDKVTHWMPLPEPPQD